MNKRIEILLKTSKNLAVCPKCNGEGVATSCMEETICPKCKGEGVIRAMFTVVLGENRFVQCSIDEERFLERQLVEVKKTAFARGFFRINGCYWCTFTRLPNDFWAVRLEVKKTSMTRIMTRGEINKTLMFFV